MTAGFLNVDGQYANTMQAKILEVLAVDDGRSIVSKGLNTEEVARKIGVSRPTSSRWLAVLEATSKVKHYDVGRSKIWFIAPKKI